MSLFFLPLQFIRTKKAIYMKESDKEKLKEATREERRQLEHEQERMTEEAGRIAGKLQTLDATDDLLQENDRLQGELDEVRSQLQEEKERSTRLEMQLNEMGKMIKKKWKLFQQLWGIPNLGQLAGTWQQTGKLPPRSSEIDKLMI